MNILTRWGFRMARANRVRTITVILAVVGFFALWTCADFVVTSAVHSTGVSETALEISSISECLNEFLHNDSREYGVFMGVCILLYRTALVLLFGSGSLFDNPFFRALINYLSFGLFLVIPAVLYSVFSVTTDECLQDYRILTSAGATGRQIRSSLLLRAVVLDLTGAFGGIAVGLFFAWIALVISADHSGASSAFAFGSRQFLDELPQFFRDPNTMLLLLIMLVIAPCMMALASAIAFRRNRQNKKPRASKRGMFRRSFTRRMFGAGGVLGGMSSRTNRRYRAIFTASFAVCLAVMALLYNILLTFQDTQLQDQDTDLEITCYDELNDPVSGTDLTESFLQQNADRFGIESCASVFPLESYWQDCIFFPLKRDLLTEQGCRYFDFLPKDGSGMVRLEQMGIEYIVLDDATFDRYAAENGIDPGTDGALLYPFDSEGRSLIKPAVSGQDVILRFLPHSFLFDEKKYDNGITGYEAKSFYCAAFGDFLHTAEPVSVPKTIRILGLVQTRVLNMDLSSPAVLFPQRTFASVAALLTDVQTPPQSFDADHKAFLLKLSDPKAGSDAFLRAVRSDPRFAASVISFGTGLQSPGQNGIDARASAYLNIRDRHADRERLALFRSTIPVMKNILLATAVWVLFVGILNTVYMNRQTRRHEQAILESIGMDGRQKTGMLLYESTLFSLRSVLFGLFGFFLILFPIWRDTQHLLRDNSLLVHGERISQSQIWWWGTTDDIVRFLRAFSEACVNTWWIFVGGAALIFALLVVTDKFIERRSKREELIQILTDDSAENYTYI